MEFHSFNYYSCWYPRSWKYLENTIRKMYFKKIPTFFWLLSIFENIPSKFSFANCYERKRMKRGTIKSRGIEWNEIILFWDKHFCGNSFAALLVTGEQLSNGSRINRKRDNRNCTRAKKRSRGGWLCVERKMHSEPILLDGLKPLAKVPTIVETSFMVRTQTCTGACLLGRRVDVTRKNISWRYTGCFTKHERCFQQTVSHAGNICTLILMKFKRTRFSEKY